MRLETPACDFGDPAPHFCLPDAHGTIHDLNDHITGKGILIAFICNHCPYVQSIADRLAQDAQKAMDDGIGVLAIMSNDFDSHPADAPDKMVAFAAQHAFPFPYLVDKEQTVARAYGAVCTPDFFGFSADGLLQYRGRLDDAQMDDTRTRTPELLNAMRHIAATGAGPLNQSPSIGCSIKWR